jgi:hypothetical protein
MFIVCEPIALGMEHVPFNASLLKTICIAFPNDEVSFYAENDHAKFVQEQIGEELKAVINWRELALPARHSKFLSRLSSDFRTIKFLLEKLECDHKKDVLVVTGNASILWALKYYTRRAHKNKKIQVVVHGDFSTLTRIPRREILNPLYYIGSLKTALTLPGYQRLQHIVLEESVRNKVIEALPFLKKHVYVIDHPIPLEGYHGDNKLALPLEVPIHFGFLGSTTEQKGFSTYLSVASEILAQFPNLAEFHLIGRVSEECRRKNLSKLASLSNTPGEERLSRKEFVDRVKNIHFVCLFYNSYYDFCASGVLMDSIAWEKPIITSKLSLFNGIHNKFGNVGYLSEKNEISRTIANIIRNKDNDLYQKQVANIRRVKRYRTPENLATKYYELVNEIALSNPDR